MEELGKWKDRREKGLLKHSEQKRACWKSLERIRGANISGP
jgi:hypothetical protein